MDHNEHYSHALQKDYMLDNFKIISILGAGGFGIAYLAEDTYLEEKYVIKEYMPSEFAYRDPASGEVHTTSPSSSENYKWGLTEFLNEAKTIKQCKHRNIVEVVRFFEANNTAYIVMPYFEGNSLSQLLKQSPNENITEEKLLAIVLPLLDGLKVLHAQNIFHRDIKPSNIYICNQDSMPILIDFGAARFSLGSRSRSITTIVTPSYSPHEQYHQHGRQGAWTDIYSMGAVMYRLISGNKPIEAPARVADPDPFVSAFKIGKGKYSKHVLAAIDHALAFKETDRPQSIEQWLLEIKGEPLPKQKSTFSSMIVGGVIAVLIISLSLLAMNITQKNKELEALKKQTQIMQRQTNDVANVSTTQEETKTNTTDTKQKPKIQAVETIGTTEAITSIKQESKIQVNTEAQTNTQLATCTDGRLNGQQIKNLVQNKIAMGRRLDVPTPYNWVELQDKNGEAYFATDKKKGERKGKWKINDNQLCWCYGKCEDYKCKYVEARNNCSVWYYIDPETSHETSKVSRWKAIED